MDATETLEQLKIGNLQFVQPKYGYRFSVDAVLLADFLAVKPDERLIDLGTGSGIVPLLASVLTQAREIVGLEIQERLVKLARENVAINHLEDRIQIVQGDLRQAAQLFRAGEFDALCSNPPYRKVGTGRINPDGEQAMARHEIACQLSELLAACKYLVKPGGKVFLIYLPARLCELFEHLRGHKLEPKRIRCIHASEKTAASLVLVEAHRDAASDLKILPPLFLYNRDGNYTDEAKRILREE
jgi:tRNA1Val (adenine37-N6)-methyltransferase